MRHRRSIFYSALLLTGVNLLLRTIGTGFQVYLSGRIGAAGIGLLQLVLSVAGLSMTAGIAGIRTSSMYLTAEELGKKRPQNVIWVISGCCGYSMIFSSAICAMVYLFAPQIALFWIGDPRTTDALRLFAAFMPVSCLCGVMIGYFTAANRISTLAAVEVAEQLFSMTITVSALHFWAGNEPSRACQAVILGSGCGAMLTLLCLVILRIKERPPKGPRIPIGRRLANTALPLALADDLKAGITSLENLMVPKRLSLYAGSADPLALFGIVCGMVFPILMFPCAILFGLAELLIPELARCSAAGSKSRIHYLMHHSLKLVLLYGVLCAGIEYICADQLCLALYKNKDAGTFLRWFSPLMIMLYLDMITDAMIKGLGQQKASVRYNILTSAMDVVLLFILLPNYGIVGYFTSFTLTHAINFILSLRRLMYITGEKIPIGVPICALTAALAAVMAASIFQSLLMQIMVYLTLLFSLLKLLKVVSVKDLRWLQHLIFAK